MFDVVIQVFFEYGFEGIILDMVIEWVGGLWGILYSFFGGKEGLFVVVIVYMIEEIFDDSVDQLCFVVMLSVIFEYFGWCFFISLFDFCCQSFYCLVVVEFLWFLVIGKFFYEQGLQQSYLLFSE